MLTVQNALAPSQGSNNPPPAQASQRRPLIHSPARSFNHLPSIPAPLGRSSQARHPRDPARPTLPHPTPPYPAQRGPAPPRADHRGGLRARPHTPAAAAWPC